MIGIIGLICAIAVLVIGAYKGLGALPLTILASLVAIVTNAMPLWDSFSIHYMKGYTSAYMSYFLLFASSALYAKLMDESGCATTIGYKFIDWFGKKNIMLVTILIVSVLTYGGVSLFVVVYAVAPIMFLLFKEANLPRHLTMACLIVGSATYTMTTLPGSPQLTNVVPTEYLGTTMTAAPILSILCTIGIFVLCLAYCTWAQKKAVALGEVWTYPENMDPTLFEIKDRSLLPVSWKAFTPIVILLLIIIVGGKFVSNSNMLATCAMLVGALLTFLLNYSKFKGKDWTEVLTNGLGGGISGIGGLAAVLAFGTVVQSSGAFTDIVKWVLSLNMHPYVRGIFATSVFSGITGSSSGGLRLMYQSLGDTFVNSGANLGVLHRLTAIAAGGLDTLPHSPGLFLMFSVLGLNHKNAYRHVFVCSVCIPVIICVIATVASIALGI
ncbi:GntP family permease [Clostridium sp. BSD9I1]|uniref:GntP family permease n=1 Tax=Clostridium sp. BSD9I1 TaxID=2003589 RepID=UPI001648A833|nr:GntP family permease [Clostridium sp. BSD9I1]